MKTEKIIERRIYPMLSTGLILLVTLAGCSASHPNTDTSTMVIEPGRGLPGVCELGMTLAQVQNRTPVLIPRFRGEAWMKRTWTGGRPVIVPALGVIGSFDSDKRIKRIMFYVQPYKEAADIFYPLISIDQPFRGSVRGGLSFADIPVTKQQVEAFFGKLPSLTRAEAFQDGQLTNGSVCITSEGGWEELRYRNKGIAFIVQSNVVGVIVIDRTRLQATIEDR
jgi:hypothetical protein